MKKHKMRKRIEELEAEVRELRRTNNELVQRLADQSAVPNQSSPYFVPTTVPSTTPEPSFPNPHDPLHPKVWCGDA